MNKKCIQCGKIYLRLPYYSHKYWDVRKYCSSICKNKAQTGLLKTAILGKCLICNKDIKVNKWKFKNGRGKCCSRKCASILKTGRKRPDMVGNKFSKDISPWNKGKKWAKKTLKKMSESHIGQKPWNKGKKTGSLSIDTRRKMSLAQKGEKGSNWKGGIIPENRLQRTGFESKIWRTAVFERDNYACHDCGKRCGKGKKVYLHAHHIKQFAFHKEDRFDISNGLTLCEQCHKKIKHKYRTSCI